MALCTLGSDSQVEPGVAPSSWAVLSARASSPPSPLPRDQEHPHAAEVKGPARTACKPTACTWGGILRSGCDACEGRSLPPVRLVCSRGGWPQLLLLSRFILNNAVLYSDGVSDG